ncbi:MAG: tRNA uridine-5-carboxymethylaminomethyl(34) synthesis GTPase MnmE [Clostridiaceae bacterium]|jgi:tRNA modification GTPase|nr:tRNA uridine-5-carboxymethylaminomethyl(34) synthesis GTPase MnmE [Clostridiaceae bacterium]
MNSMIAAYSGGALPAAIGICRVSGPGVLTLADKIFRPKKGRSMGEGPFSAMRYGEVLDSDGRALDLCLACCYRGPASYTGEDMLEIFCHGSQAVAARILERCMELGAQPAQAGEFTQRAFLAGKMDLIGAEAVADLIEAQSAAAAKNAAAQLKGGISQQIRAIRQAIMDQLTHFYAVCDYPDEDLDPFLNSQACQALTRCADEMEKLLAGFERGRTLTQGLPVTILGKPNAGKSSLLNALAGYDRAIVTEEAGATRDIVTETLRCGDTVLRLSDTAGLRQAESQAERIGIEKARQSARQSQLVICVFDGSRPLDDQDLETIQASADLERVAVRNKMDLGQAAQPQLEEQFGRIFCLSAQTGEGIEDLCQWLASLTPQLDQALITSARQAALLDQAAQSCRLAAQSAEQGFTADAFLADAEQALRLLDQTLGESVGEDIVHGIFSRFCVGK